MRPNLLDSLKWVNEQPLGLGPDRRARRLRIDRLQTPLLSANARPASQLLDPHRRGNAEYPLRLDLEIRNLTGRTAVISNARFEFGKLRPDPRALGDTPSGEFEVRFPGVHSDALTEVEYLVRTKESLCTFIPLDPAQNPADARRMLAEHKVGRITCTVTWLDERPRSHKLRRRL